MTVPQLRSAIKNILPPAIVDYIRYHRHSDTRIPSYRRYRRAVRNGSGIEIGGPSVIFETTIPIYRLVANLDGVNFSCNTLWEGRIQEGQTYNYISGRTGHQFVCEGTDLREILSESYDFLLSSNCLEHVANPLKAIKEWRRVLRTDGFMLLVLPNKQHNFDHNRPVTTFAHLLDDYQNDVTEHDLTHLGEILQHHDLSMDIPGLDAGSFRLRSLDNFNNRTLHHHVFDLQLITEILSYFRIQLVQTDTTARDFIALGVKL